MLMKGRIRGQTFIMENPDWEDPTEDDLRALFEAGWLKHDTNLEEILKEYSEEGWVEWETHATQETLETWVDNHHVETHKSSWGYKTRGILTHDNIGKLLEQLIKQKRGHIYPTRRDNCWECNGTGRGLQGGMRGYAYTEDDFREDPDFEERYFGGYYDGPCQNCGGKGYFENAHVRRDFEVNTDSIRFNKWLEEHKKTCERKDAGRCHEKCIPASEPQYAVDMFENYHAQEDRAERQREADRRLYMAESGWPAHERY